MEPRVLNPVLERLHKEVIEICKKPDNYVSLLKQSTDYVRKPPRAGTCHKPGVIEIHGKEKLIFIGDIHGDYYTLLKVLNTIWEKVGEYTVVFLGDYIDRGYMQLESLSIALKLKAEYGDSIVLLRGNHEPPSWLIPYPHDYIYSLWERFGEKSKEVYSASLELFDNMPLVLINENSLIALHGGPPLSVLRADSWRVAFEVGSSKASPKLLENVLWSDPAEDLLDHAPSPRGAGVLYGPLVSRKTLELVNGKFILRGHEAVNGLKYSHGGAVVTVFTSPLVYGFECGGVAIYDYCEEKGDWCLNWLCIRPRAV